MIEPAGHPVPALFRDYAQDIVLGVAHGKSIVGVLLGRRICRTCWIHLIYVDTQFAVEAKKNLLGQLLYSAKQFDYEIRPYGCDLD